MRRLQRRIQLAKRSGPVVVKERKREGKQKREKERERVRKWYRAQLSQYVGCGVSRKLFHPHNKEACAGGRIFAEYEVECLHIRDMLLIK